MKEPSSASTCMLVSHWGALYSLSACFAQLLGLLLVFQPLTICVTFSTDLLSPGASRIGFIIQFWIWRAVYIREFSCHTTGLATHRNLRSASRGEHGVTS